MACKLDIAETPLIILSDLPLQLFFCRKRQYGHWTVAGVTCTEYSKADQDHVVYSSCSTHQ